jgi:hypothetical protein
LLTDGTPRTRAQLPQQVEGLRQAAIDNADRAFSADPEQTFSSFIARPQDQILPRPSGRIQSETAAARVFGLLSDTHQ